MKILFILLISTILAVTSAFAQQPERVDLGEATSAVTSTINALNTFYHSLEKEGEVDPEIRDMISRINNLTFPCRDAIIHSNYNGNSMSEDKKSSVVSTAKGIATELENLDAKEDKTAILSKLRVIERKMQDLSKSFGMKVKKKKK